MTPAKSFRPRSAAPSPSARARPSARGGGRVAEQVLDDPQMSFKVYTPEQLRHVTVRSAHVPSPRHPDAPPPVDTTLRPATVLRYVGIALAATVGLFVGFIAIANATDDTLVTGNGAQHASLSSKPKAAAPHTVTGSSAPSAPPIVVGAASGDRTDFELPDDSAPVQRTAVKRGGKQGKRSVGVRSAP